MADLNWLYGTLPCSFVISLSRPKEIDLLLPHSSLMMLVGTT